jgi:hypothetical protein
MQVSSYLSTARGAACQWSHFLHGRCYWLAREGCCLCAKPWCCSSFLWKCIWAKLLLWVLQGIILSCVNSLQWLLCALCGGLWSAAHSFLNQSSLSKLDSGLISWRPQKHVASFSASSMRPSPAPGARDRERVSLFCCWEPHSSTCWKKKFHNGEVSCSLWHLCQALKNVILSKKFANLHRNYFIWLNISLNHMSLYGLLKRLMLLDTDAYVEWK